MSQTYSYQVECPSCSVEHTHTRDTPYVRPRLHMLCPRCKAVQQKEQEFQGVQDCGALQTNQGCFNCAHFTPHKDGKGWGKCGLGHVYDSEHPDVYDKPLGLTYELDTCNDWTKEDEEDGPN